MNYKEMIIEMIEKIDNEKLVQYLYGLIKGLIEKWG